MVSATKIVLFAVGALAQSPSQVGQDLRDLDRAVQTLASRVQSLNGGMASVISFIAQIRTVDSLIAKASADANSIPGTANSADTNSILAIETDALASDLSAVVTAILTKSSAVYSNERQIFKGQLSTLYTSASGLAGELVTRAALPQKAAASSASSALLSNIGRVTALFN